VADALHHPARQRRIEMHEQVAYRFGEGDREVFGGFDRPDPRM